MTTTNGLTDADGVELLELDLMTGHLLTGLGTDIFIKSELELLTAVSLTSWGLLHHFYELPDWPSGRHSSRLGVNPITIR